MYKTAGDFFHNDFGIIKAKDKNVISSSTMIWFLSYVLTGRKQMKWIFY